MFILLTILAVLAYFLLKRRKLSGPLTLKKDSWHARIHNSIYYEPLPRDICTYFWKIVFTLVALTVILVVFLGLGLGIPAFIGTFVLGFGGPKEAYAAGLTFFNLWLSGAGLISLVIGIVWAISANINTEFAKIVKSFIQAKKDKTCIEIQWAESTEKDEGVSDD